MVVIGSIADIAGLDLALRTSMQALISKTTMVTYTIARCALLIE